MVSRRGVLGLCAAALFAAAIAQTNAPATVDYARLADMVVNHAWKIAPGEHVVVFADPAFDRGMGEPLRAAIRKAGGVIEEVAAPTSASVKDMSAADRDCA